MNADNNMLVGLRETWNKRTFLFGSVIVTLVSLFGLRYLWFNSRMWFDLENHDTRVLLRTIRGVEQPFKWFVHDWPLYNGFYRPLPALSFEVDDRLYGNNLLMYCFTNWWIGLACSFGVVWFVWELFRKRSAAVAAGTLFAAWQSGLTDYLPIEWVGGVVALLLMIVGTSFGSGWKNSLIAAALALLLAREASSWQDVVDVVGMDFAYRSIGWPVGRTATMATMFILPCVAAYCRWERGRKGKWAIASIAFLILAMMCYEQVVVVPALLMGSAVALRLQGVPTRWAWHLLPWTTLAVYIFLHSHYLPKTRYHDQAYRGIGGGIRDMLSWLFPASFEIKFIPTFISPEIGIYFVFIERFWRYSVQIVSCTISYLSFRPYWLPITFGVLASVGAYAPMAFQQPLVHYHHLPLAVRTPFVVWLSMIAWNRGRQALIRPQSAS
jgi:hypothetical protein